MLAVRPPPGTTPEQVVPTPPVPPCRGWGRPTPRLDIRDDVGRTA